MYMIKKKMKTKSILGMLSYLKCKYRFIKYYKITIDIWQKK